MTDPDRPKGHSIPVLLPRHALALCLFAGLAMVLAGILANELAGGLATSSEASGPRSGSGGSTVPSPAWFIWATAASELSVGLVTVAAWIAWRRRLLASAGPDCARAFLPGLVPMGRPLLRHVAGALVLAVSVAPFAELAARWVQVVLRANTTSGDIVAHTVKGAGYAEFALMLVTLAVLPAVIEEVLFRGVVFAAFARRSANEALLVSSLLFAAFHLDPTQVAGTSLLGLAFGLGRLRSGTIVTSMVAHALYNAFVLFSLRFAATAPEDYAQHASWAALAVGAVGSSLGVWLLFQKRPSSPPPSSTTSNAA